SVIVIVIAGSPLESQQGIEEGFEGLAILTRGVGNCVGNSCGYLGVEHRRNDVAGVQLVSRNAGSDGRCCYHEHRVGNIAGLGVEQSAEKSWECQHIVNLVWVI